MEQFGIRTQVGMATVTIIVEMDETLAEEFKARDASIGCAEIEKVMVRIIAEKMLDMGGTLKRPDHWPK